MSPPTEEPLAVARAVAAEAHDSDLSFVAAGLAYYSLMAVTPALVVGFLLLVEVGGRGLAGGVVGATAGVLSPQGEHFIRDTLGEVSARSGVSVVAVGLSLWGARRLYRGLDQGVRGIYGVDGHSVDDAADLLRVLAFGGLGTVGIVGVAVAASLATDGGPARLLALPVTFVAALVVTYPLLNGVAPGEERTGSLPGALFTSATWTAGAAVVGAFASGPSQALYGVLGGLLLLLTWFFAANFLLLLGFTVAAVVERRRALENGNDA